MYKCRYDHPKCISLGNVCDNIFDCSYHDDEMFCELKSVQCPISCNCLIFAISCVQLLSIQFSYIISKTSLFSFFGSVFISETNIPLFELIEYQLQKAYFIYLPKNNIHFQCPIMFLRNVVLLDLKFNNLFEIHPKCFSLSIFLKSLSLNNNHIIYLSIYSFHNLHNLMFLNLSNNPFTNLPLKCFWGLFYLKILDLGTIKFKKIQAGIFTFANVKVIKSLDYKLSCVSSDYSFCTSYPPWYVSCSDILPGTLLKLIYIIISILVICLNSLSTLIKVTEKCTDGNILKIKVIGLSLSDSLCGIYLGVIWVSDILFKSVFIINEELWKSHPLCFAGCTVVLWYTISNQLLLVYLSGTRLMAILYPIKRKLISWNQVVYQVNIIHMFSISFSLFLTLVFKYIESYLPTNLCLPFIDPSGLSLLTKIISWTVITTQSLFSIIIALMNIFLVYNINKSIRSLQTSKSTNISSKITMYQLIITSTSNIICWFPANTIYLSAMFLSSYSIDLVIWTTVMITPINSIINPSIFMITSIKKISWR